MNSRRPTTAGIDQLSLNLSVTRSPDTPVLVSILLWSRGTLGGDVAGAVLFGPAGYLEAVGGTAQKGGLALPALGGLCDGGSLLTAVVGTSVGGGADEGMNACLGAVPDGAELHIAKGSSPGRTSECSPWAGPPPWWLCRRIP